MLIKIVIQNIRQKKYRNLIMSLAVAIGTASIIVFLGLSNGIKNATFAEIEKNNPLTQITVRPATTNTGLLPFITGQNSPKITPEKIDQIKQIPEIKNIFPEIQFNNFASVEASLLGFSLITDAMIFGVEKDFISNDLKTPSIWDKTSEPYPAIIPRKIIDIYNFTIATPQGLPLISEEMLIGKEIQLYPNYSTFFPGLSENKTTIKLQVAGFSEKVNLIGVTLPLNIVEELNQQYATPTQNYLELFIETTSPSTTKEVATQIEKLGLSTQYFQKDIQEIEARFTYLTVALGSISAIIIFTAAIAIISTFLALVSERKKEIGLLRAIGATKSDIKKLILMEAGLIGLTGSLIGIICGKLFSLVMDNYALLQLKNTTFLPESLFAITPLTALASLTFGVIITIISAYIPALKAANISPIEALNK